MIKEERSSSAGKYEKYSNTKKGSGIGKKAREKSKKFPQKNKKFSDVDPKNGQVS
jgi:hypothetical protein